MSYHIESDGKAAEIHLAGELTFSAHGKFRALLDALRHAAPHKVTFNLAKVEYVDAAGLGLLLVVRDVVTGHGGRSELAGAEGEVGRMLEVARFRELFAAS